MTYPHFFFAAMRTIANVARYLLSGGRTMQLEGRFRRGWYRNWSGDRRHRATFCSPKTAGEVSALVRRSSSMRVVGAGHSFNDGLATTGTTVSLDSLARVIKIDRTNRQATVEAGMRLRDLTRELHGEGLALRSLASHDAQSIAGLLSTDVHGTGREPAHMSDQVISLRLVDGNGTVHDVGPGDDLFRAAVGGAGSVGIITQVTLQCVDAFKLRQASHVEDQTWARANLGRLLAEHDHLSFYAYPFTKKIHVHSWDRTDESRSRLGARREALNEAKAALVAATVGDATAH